MKSENHIDFENVYHYDTLKTGVTLPVSLKYGSLETTVRAKIDTGASHSIFERLHGEYFGLEIENGELLSFSTVMGSFRAFGHELSVRFLNIEIYTKIYFAEDDNFRKNVLGRQGWHDRVKFGLIDYEGKLFLSEYQ
jgi:hypothetical protein